MDYAQLIALQRDRLRRAANSPMRLAARALQNVANEFREKLGLPMVYYVDGSRYLVKRPR